MASQASRQQRAPDWCIYFFLYDCSKVREEGDPTRAGIYYFFPSQTPSDLQEFLIGQIAGVICCFTDIAGSPPTLIRLRKLKFAVRSDRNFLWALGCTMDIPDVSCRCFLDQLIGVFTFYNGSIQHIYQTERQEVLGRQWDLYTAHIQQHPCELHKIFNALWNLDRTKVDPLLLLKAALILQTCQRCPHVLAGCILYSNLIVSTQLPPVLTAKVLAYQPGASVQGPSRSSEEVLLPQNVAILTVFVTEDEAVSLRRFPFEWAQGVPASPEPELNTDKMARPPYLSRTLSDTLDCEVWHSPGGENTCGPFETPYLNPGDQETHQVTVSDLSQSCETLTPSAHDPGLSPVHTDCDIKWRDYYYSIQEKSRPAFPASEFKPSAQLDKARLDVYREVTGSDDRDRGLDRGRGNTDSLRVASESGCENAADYSPARSSDGLTAAWPTALPERTSVESGLCGKRDVRVGIGRPGDGNSSMAKEYMDMAPLPGPASPEKVGCGSVDPLEFLRASDAGLKDSGRAAGFRAEEEEGEEAVERARTLGSPSAEEASQRPLLVEMALYVHTVKELVIALLAEDGFGFDQNAIEDVYHSTLASLNGLEVHLSETLPRAKVPATKPSSHLPPTLGTQDSHFVRAAGLMHTDLTRSPTIHEMSVRNTLTAVYSCRSPAQETHFQQLGAPVRNSGVPNPHDSIFTLPGKAKQKLLKHGVNLL
eukprot:gi/632967696/ref/XP_007900120.1/ PREDICTED: Hermansky-Pudlak syndrome 4 protein [Callorhinchus milii]